MWNNFLLKFTLLLITNRDNQQIFHFYQNYLVDFLIVSLIIKIFVQDLNDSLKYFITSYKFDINKIKIKKYLIKLFLFLLINLKIILSIPYKYLMKNK